MSRRHWLSRPGGDLSFECEAALQVFFADAGSVHDLKANLASVRRRAEAELSDSRARMTRWLDGDLHFPERLQYTAMAKDLVHRIDLAVAGWASTWEENVGAWTTTQPDPVSTRQARQHLSQLIEFIDRRHPASAVSSENLTPDRR